MGAEGMEGGGGGEYIPIATLLPPERPALRWAAMRAILTFDWLWGTKSQDSVHRPQHLKRKESRSGIEPRSFRLPAYRPTARPNRLSIQYEGWMEIYIWRIKTSTQNLASSQRQIRTVHRCRLSQAKTTKDVPASKVQTWCRFWRYDGTVRGVTIVPFVT